MRRLVVAVLTALGVSVGVAQANTIDLISSGYYDFTHLPAQVDAVGGTLILSDSPEYVDKPGVLSAGTVDGEGRIYFYHVNEMKEPQKISLVIENKSRKKEEVTVHRQLQSVSTPDYFLAGRDLSRKDLEQPLFGDQLVEESWKKGEDSNAKGGKKKDKKSAKTQSKADAKTQSNMDAKAHDANKTHSTFHEVDLRKAIKPYTRKEPFGGEKQVLGTFSLKPGERRQLFTDLDHTKVMPDDLFTGLFDFTTTGPSYVQVMMLPMKENPVEASKHLASLPIDDVRLRGTYQGAFRTMSVPTVFNSDLNAAYVEVANDREDPFITGVDELDHNESVKDSGNYGVSYHLTIKTRGSQPFRLYANPQGGAYSGSFVVSTDYESKRYDVGMPYIGHKTILDTAYLGTYHGGDTLYIEFMPAGASNLPLKFLLVPEGQVVEQTESSPSVITNLLNHL